MSAAPESTPRLAIDDLQVRRLHARDRSIDDFILREVSRRMSDRLTTVRHAANTVVDLGCGAGADLPQLRERFPEAWVCGLDASRARLQRAAAATAPAGVAARVAGWLGGRRSKDAWLQADFAHLPFAAGTVDGLWSNLALHWSSEPHRALAEWGRVVKPGGLVVFSAFGPDTLAEVRAAFAAVDEAEHVMPFTDMHDYGDMLIEAGFVTPVVDMERLTLTYSTIDSLWRDVRSLGGNASTGRIRTLRGRRFRERVVAALDRARAPDGRYALTFELVFAHAWKGERRATSQGEAIVTLHRSR